MRIMCTFEIRRIARVFVVLDDMYLIAFIAMLRNSRRYSGWILTASKRYRAPSVSNNYYHYVRNLTPQSSVRSIRFDHDIV